MWWFGVGGLFICAVRMRVQGTTSSPHMRVVKHALKLLGLLGRLRGVSGSSGGVVYALLAALDFSITGGWGPRDRVPQR
jgi:hypothetical protein